MDQLASIKTLQTGQLVGGVYRLRAPLGAGGMGVVYEAAYRGTSVAIKLVRPDRTSDPDVAHRLHREAVAARYALHPNVVAVLDHSDPDAETPYIVMEYVRGVSLGAAIHRCGVLPLLRAADIACQILAGLAATHAAGVVHADIKSDNVIVDPRRDGSDVVKIIDFGLASVRRPDHVALEPDHDANGHLLMSGTPQYMAPEVIRGEGATAASDIYATGVVLYEMLIGKTPFSGNSAEILDSHLHADPVRPSLRHERFIPRALERVIMKALDKDPSRRHASAAAFAAAIVAATPAIEPVSFSRYESDCSTGSTESMTRDQRAPLRNAA